MNPMVLSANGKTNSIDQTVVAGFDVDDLAYLTKPRMGPSHVDKGLDKLTVANLKLKENKVFSK